jgi:transcriptional regulator with XRE-family HTH domain
MRSIVKQSLPFKLVKQVKALGVNISIARKKRKFTQASLAERCRISVDTVKRIEKGDYKVSMAAYFMVLDRLGKSVNIDQLCPPETDWEGNLILESQLPKRVRNQS